jgi:hypothetical protein
MAQIPAAQLVVPPPPPSPAGQAVPPVIPVPASLTPEPAHGDITKLLISLVKTDMANMQALLAPPDGLMLVVNALGVEHGHCAFLVVTPSMFANNPLVKVVHCVRQYMLPASTSNAAADPLQHRTILFSGDMSNGLCPRLWLEPATGLPAHFQETATEVPTQAAVQAFYQNHTASELMPRRAATTNMPIRYLTYIPQAWVPACIGGLSQKRPWTELRKSYS